MKKIKHSSTTFIWIYLVLSIIGFVVISSIFNSMIEEHDNKLTGDIDNLIAEKMDDSIGYMLETIDAMSRFISFQDSLDFNQLYEQMNRDSKEEEYSSVGLVATDGTVYGLPSEQEEMEKWGFAEKALAADTIVVSDPYRSATTGKLVFTFFAPIYEQGERVGCVFVTYPLTEIQNIASSSVLQDEIEIYIMDVRAENMIFCSGTDQFKMGNWSSARILRKQIDAAYVDEYDAWATDLHAGSKMGAVNFAIDNVIYTQVHRNIEKMPGWCVLVRVPNNLLSDTLRQFKVVTIIFAVVSVLIFSLTLVSLKAADAREKAKFEYMSTHDALTDVYNRNAFDLVVQKYLNEEGKSEHGCLVFVDIDYFKQINDKYGHAIGDDALVAFSDCLKQLFAEDSIVARYGGDEFVLLVKRIDSIERMNQRMDSLKNELEAIKLDGTDSDFTLSFSAGISMFPDHGNQFEELVKCADEAVYEVKSNGRGHYRWYQGAKN